MWQPPGAHRVSSPADQRMIVQAVEAAGLG
jgi:hypothetical protein